MPINQFRRLPLSIVKVDCIKTIETDKKITRTGNALMPINKKETDSYEWGVPEEQNLLGETVRGPEIATYLAYFDMKCSSCHIIMRIYIDNLSEDFKDIVCSNCKHDVRLEDDEVKDMNEMSTETDIEDYIIRNKMHFLKEDEYLPRNGSLTAVFDPHGDVAYAEYGDHNVFTIECTTCGRNVKYSQYEIDKLFDSPKTRDIQTLRINADNGNHHAEGELRRLRGLEEDVVCGICGENITIEILESRKWSSLLEG